MLHLENFFEKSFALLLTTPKEGFMNINIWTGMFEYKYLDIRKNI